MYLKYRNGNYLVTRSGSGTMTKRCFRLNEELQPEFPDSIDLKISNRCSTECPYCHEDSNKLGKLAKYDDLIMHLSVLPEEASIEIAIGGGNILEDKESKNLFRSLAIYLYEHGKSISTTVNEREVTEENLNFLYNITYVNSTKKDCFYKESIFIETIPINIGISLGPNTTYDRVTEINKLIESVCGWPKRGSIVFHIILGLFPLDLLETLLSKNLKILILGYKQFGRSKETELPENIKNFEVLIKKHLLEKMSIGSEDLTQLNLNIIEENNCILGFDNLAIEQLKLRDSISKLDFSKVFLGEEFSCSMYIDGVEGKYAKSSTEPKESRVDWNSCDIITYFKNDKSKK